MLVSNFEVYLTKDGNGAINFMVGDELRKIIIPKGDEIPKQIFDLYFGQLKSFKERHYAIAKWIVEDIRRMGYVFKRMPLSRDLYLPVKLDHSVSNFYPQGMTKEEKLKFLWSEVDRINKKYRKTLDLEDTLAKYDFNDTAPMFFPTYSLFQDGSPVEK